jgi:Antibiotic biosynthesis monooxygenase
MFARRISIQLKPNTLAEFTKTVENDIVPLLRKQPGFKDEIVCGLPEGNKVLAISLWDTQQNAEHYDGGAYKDVIKMLGTVIDGTPKVGTTEVLHSTFHQLRTAVPAA